MFIRTKLFLRGFLGFWAGYQRRNKPGMNLALGISMEAGVFNWNPFVLRASSVPRPACVQIPWGTLKLCACGGVLPNFHF